MRSNTRKIARVVKPKLDKRFIVNIPYGLGLIISNRAACMAQLSVLLPLAKATVTDQGYAG
jgi:hypothetical protein